MKLDHYSGASLARVCFLFLVGSASAQLMSLVPALRLAALITLIPATVFCVLVGIRYWGVLTDQPWAEEMQIYDVDNGILGVLVIISPILIGGVTAWLTY